ncbi:hypothetical protein HLB44_31430 [Aquincola sp. S2]|uniref:Uncharacterized protein n=1 Tax=Pseudaquabacterium terrae TaxID=2732868 RepID=A0ABX2ES38_9BURK|nr:hypothetical protein [Aquabacterium terrae]NRF71509.1 hypothetical protein [Aquabacterium terrae]
MRAGDAVESVAARGGPHEYRPFVCRAMRAVTCIPDSRGDRFVFSIRFDPEASRSASARRASGRAVTNAERRTERVFARMTVASADMRVLLTSKGTVSIAPCRGNP